MKKIKYLFVVVVLIITAACDDYLDIVPKGKIIPTKTNDYRLLLNQLDSESGTIGLLPSYSTDVFLSDNMKFTPITISLYRSYEKNLFTFAEHTYNSAEEDPDWSSFYAHVYKCNVVIKEVMDSEGGSLSEKKELLSEAKVHRAFSYLILVNLYAKHYNPTTAASDLGVPIRAGIGFEEDLSRKSVKEVYDLIITDLKDAVDNLPAKQKNSFNYRPSKASAYGLLARTYLYMGEYQKAIDNANLSLQNASELIDYKTVTAFTYPIPSEDAEAILIKSPSTATSLFYCSKTLENAYNKTKDLRFQVKYIPDSMTNPDFNYGFFSSKWYNKTPVKGYTTPETYLILAEAYARLNQVKNSIDKLNHLRKYRFAEGSNYTLSTSDPQIALDFVKKERRCELAFQGLRLFDIKRYNLIDNANISITHDLQGKTYTLQANSPRLVLPIARKYIEMNPEIKQNPR
ncbi:MAG: RagB/SusD family nutrient uptake outer membrane protein [Bacteroidales bacterium]|nr:RagB/SusD family nutrient uptake outer membrane protein [Bacteroidales bacterium]